METVRFAVFPKGSTDAQVDGVRGGVVERTEKVVRAFAGLEEGTAGLRDERLIKEVDDGGGEAEAADDLPDEVGGKGELGREGGGDTPLAVEDEVEGGVVGEEPLGRAGEGKAVDGLHELAEAGGGEEAAEIGVAVGARGGEVAADGEELFALGHVGADGDGDGGGADVEVEARS